MSNKVAKVVALLLISRVKNTRIRVSERHNCQDSGKGEMYTNRSELKVPSGKITLTATIDGAVDKVKVDPETLVEAILARATAVASRQGFALGITSNGHHEDRKSKESYPFETIRRAGEIEVAFTAKFDLEHTASLRDLNTLYFIAGGIDQEVAQVISEYLGQPPMPTLQPELWTRFGDVRTQRELAGSTVR